MQLNRRILEHGLQTSEDWGMILLKHVYLAVTACAHAASLVERSRDTAGFIVQNASSRVLSRIYLSCWIVLWDFINITSVSKAADSKSF